MQNHQSSYKRWSWIVALILALILLWMLLTGRGPSSACCEAPIEAAAPVEAITPAATPEAFGFTASADEFSSNGDGANVSWFSQADGLKALLAGGDALQIQGDDKAVVLRGTVDTDAIRQQKGADVQAFFGAAVTVDNQLLVKAAEPEPVAAMSPPPAAKLYFDSGKTALHDNYDDTLDPIVAWLNAHPESKAILSGYHDSNGNQAANEELAYKRAKAVQAGLIAAGIDVMRVEFRKPENADNSGDMAEARRVEVSVE
jgi:cytochrome c oxidase subunit 2